MYITIYEVDLLSKGNFIADDPDKCCCRMLAIWLQYERDTHASGIPDAANVYSERKVDKGKSTNHFEDFTLGIGSVPTRPCQIPT